MLSHKTDLSLVLAHEQSTELDGSQALAHTILMPAESFVWQKIPTFRKLLLSCILSRGVENEGVETSCLKPHLTC